MKTKLSPARKKSKRSESPEALFMKHLVTTLSAIEEGDFSSRLPSDWVGLEGRVAQSLNSISARMERFNVSLLRLRQQVGDEGKINVRLSVGDSIGSWAERIEAINSLVEELS